MCWSIERPEVSIVDVNYRFNHRGYGTHQAIIELVPGGSRVLDVGCASGYLMEHLRRVKNCQCVGIEPNSNAADMASALGFDVIKADALAAANTAADRGRFDCIIFGDVLEHMVDPGQALRQYRSLLTLDGKIVVSLPNVVSLMARLRIACGIWRYQDMGIFDRTHLRFFTIRTGRELLAAAGLSIVEQRFVGPLTFYGGRRLERVTRLRPQILANNVVWAARLGA